MNLLSIFLTSWCLLVVSFPTPLQTYVWTPDTSFSYQLLSQTQGPNTTTYWINITSQTWLSPQDSTISLWWHWFGVVVPHQLEHGNQSMVLVSDGNNVATLPSDSLPVAFAVQTRQMVGMLMQVPNEPAVFRDGMKRTEDAIIAYTWTHFFQNETEPQWIIHLPMVKSVVRALDVMQDFAPKMGFPKPEKFMITGASKRGWVAWLLPSVDSRVNAIAPIVIPILNTSNVFNHIWQSLGLWSYVFADLFAMNVTGKLNSQPFQDLLDIVDPAVYMQYLVDVPKYMIFSTGDEFFLPDSSKNFYNNLQGEYQLRMVPNTDHFISIPNLVNNIASFLLYITHGDTPPNIKEHLIYSNDKETGTILVYPSQPPILATLWSANTVSTTRRDFRLTICPTLPECHQNIIWKNQTLKPNLDGSFSASLSAPKEGWSGFFIELTYKTNYSVDGSFIITSQVMILPDVFPFPACGNNCGRNVTSNVDFQQYQNRPY